MIDRIEVFVTELPTRIKRIFSSGSYDTGPPGQQLGKPVLVRINCGGLAVQAQLEAAAMAHFYASTPAKRMMGAGEFVFGLNTNGDDPLVPGTDFLVKEGHVNVPKGPGLGITIDEAALKKHTLRHESIE